MTKLCSALLALAMASAIFTSCGAKSARQADTYAVNSAPAMEMKGDGGVYGEANTVTAGVMPPMQSPSGQSADKVLPDDMLRPARMLVKNADLTMESTDFDAASAAILQAVATANGYVEMSNLTNDTYAGEKLRHAAYTLRVPAAQYDAFINQVGTAANVLAKNESVDDITLQYVDVESRLFSLQTQRDTLLALMDKAEKLEDVVALQASLTEVLYQIESYSAQRRVMNSEIEYSKISIRLAEVQRATDKQETFPQKLSAAFKNGWYGFAEGLERAFLRIIYNLPFVLLWLLLLSAVAIVGRRMYKKRKIAVQKAALKPQACCEEPPVDGEKKSESQNER